MLYVVWVDGGPRLVTGKLTEAVKNARSAIAGARVSKLMPEKPADPYASVIFIRKPDKSTYVERWYDTESQHAFEAGRCGPPFAF